MKMNYRTALISCAIIGCFLTFKLKKDAVSMTKSGQGGAVGIRNKNPLNIEYNERNNWKGQTGRNGRFCTFSHNKWGFRAGARVLKSYRNRKVRTITDIVNTFAPPNENDSERYVSLVCQWAGLPPSHVVDTNNDREMASVLRAMARMEVGIEFPLSDVMAGIALA